MYFFFFFKQKTAYEMRMSDWSSSVLFRSPGMRELKPTGEEAVADSFADIEELASHCKFRDCQHAREPGCAVRAAIEAGKLDPRRFASRSEARRVGTGGGRTCRSGWSR